MTDFKEDLIAYRLKRAKETLEDAEILAGHAKWNSSFGVKSVFSENFIKSKIISPELGKIYAQLFTFRQKGDYSNFFDFTGERVLPYFEPVKTLIQTIETRVFSELM